MLRAGCAWPRLRAGAKEALNEEVNFLAKKAAAKAATPPTTKQKGDAAEDAALRHLQAAGLRLLARNYRTPGRGGGEIDLILRAPDGTLVFVEVRQRASTSHGGAAASVAPRSSGASSLPRATTWCAWARRRRAALTWWWWNRQAAMAPRWHSTAG
jgi:Holliday junction resolvase-like predicted endonuclease